MRILFHTVNDMGLGHLRRSCAIIYSLRKLFPLVKPIIITNANYKRLTDILQIPSIILPLPMTAPRSNVDQLGTRLPATTVDELAFSSIKVCNPDIVLFDTYVGATLIRELRQINTKKCLVFRKCRPDTIVRYVRNGYFNNFDLTLIPHNELDFKTDIPMTIISDLENQSQVVYTGPILFPSFNTIESRSFEFEASKSESKIILLLSGGGGYDAIQSAFFQKAIEAIQICAKKSKQLIRCAKIIGPFSTEKSIDPNIITIREPIDVLYYIKNSDLVISHGGYNSVNEVVAAGSRAIFCAFYRKTEDQAERLRSLNNRAGTVIVHHDINEKRLATIIEKVLNSDIPNPQQFNGASIAADSISNFISKSDAENKNNHVANILRKTTSIDVMWNDVASLLQHESLPFCLIHVTLGSAEVAELDRRVNIALDQLIALGIEQTDISISYLDIFGGAQLPALAKRIAHNQFHCLISYVEASVPFNTSNIFYYLEECRNLKLGFSYEISKKID